MVMTMNPKWIVICYLYIALMLIRFISYKNNKLDIITSAIRILIKDGGSCL